MAPILDNEAPFSPEYTEEDCNGVLYGPYSPSSANWHSSNPAVATVNSTSGEVSCVAPGSANISATFSTRSYFDFNGRCRS